jgi:hypothetical protein
MKRIRLTANDGAIPPIVDPTSAPAALPRGNLHAQAALFLNFSFVRPYRFYGSTASVRTLQQKNTAYQPHERVVGKEPTFVFQATRQT